MPTITTKDGTQNLRESGARRGRVMSKEAAKMPIVAALFLGLASGMTCVPPSRAMARLELLFGTSRPHSAPVSEVDWQAFLDSEVIPRFPAGLTVLRGPGQWRGSDGIVAREQSDVHPIGRGSRDSGFVQSPFTSEFRRLHCQSAPSTNPYRRAIPTPLDDGATGGR